MQDDLLFRGCFALPRLSAQMNLVLSFKVSSWLMMSISSKQAGRCENWLQVTAQQQILYCQQQRRKCGQLAWRPAIPEEEEEES